MALFRSSSVPLERLDRVGGLAVDEESDLGFMIATYNWMHMKENISSVLDTDPGEGIMNKLEFAAGQTNDRIQLHT